MIYLKISTKIWSNFNCVLYWSVWNSIKKKSPNQDPLLRSIVKTIFKTIVKIIVKTIIKIRSTVFEICLKNLSFFFFFIIKSIISWFAYNYINFQHLKNSSQVYSKNYSNATIGFLYKLVYILYLHLISTSYILVKVLRTVTIFDRKNDKTLLSLSPSKKTINYHSKLIN